MLKPDLTKPTPTSNLNFAASILAAGILQLIGVELGEDGKPVYIFDDYHGIIPELLRKFSRGIFPFVNPKLFCDARAYLVETGKAEATGAQVRR